MHGIAAMVVVGGLLVTLFGGFQLATNQREGIEGTTSLLTIAQGITDIAMNPERNRKREEAVRIIGVGATLVLGGGVLLLAARRERQP